MRAFLLTVAILSSIPAAALAQTDVPPRPGIDVAPDAMMPMTPERLARILRAVDPLAAPSGGGIALTLDDVPVLVFMDAAADRMRAVVPVASVEGLSPEDLMRVLQANFDTALDARYAVAGGRLWSVYLHPLRSLQRDQFLSGLAQVVTLAQTYGGLYASGAMSFGAGDSGRLHRELLDDLRERGEDL